MTKPWEPIHGRVLARVAGALPMVLIERACSWAEDMPYPACGMNYFTVELKHNEPDWTTVQYHKHLNEGQRRLGLTKWIHPDLRIT